MEHSGNIPIFNFPGTLFWEYSPEFHRELFPNISGIYHRNVPQIFREHIYARGLYYKIFIKILKGYLGYKTVFCHKVPLDV